MSDLFGSVDPSTLSSMSKLTEEQAALLSKITGLVSGQVGTGAEPYSGDITAGASPIQQQTWDAVSNLLSGGLNQDASKQAIEKILGGTTNVPGPATVEGYDVGTFDPTAIQDWYQNALVKPAMDTWEKKVAPAVQEKFIAQNAGSSGAANRAIAGSASDLMSQLNAQLADKLQGEKNTFDTQKFTAGMTETGAKNQAETDFITRLFSSGQADIDRLAAVPGLESTTMTDLFKTLGLGSAAGAEQQAIDQNKLVDAYTKWQQGQAYNNPWLQYLNPSMSTSAIEPVVTQGGSQQGAASTLSPIIAALLSM